MKVISNCSRKMCHNYHNAYLDFFLYSIPLVRKCRKLKGCRMTWGIFINHSAGVCACGRLKCITYVSWCSGIDSRQGQRQKWKWRKCWYVYYENVGLRILHGYFGYLPRKKYVIKLTFRLQSHSEPILLFDYIFHNRHIKQERTTYQLIDMTLEIYISHVCECKRGQ